VGVVEKKPVHSELLDRLGKLLEIDRLHDVAVDAQMVTFNHVILFLGGGKYDDGNGPGVRIVLDAVQNLQAVDLGELEVEEYELGRILDVASLMNSLAEEKVEGFRAVAGHLDTIGDIGLAQGAKGEFQVLGRILHNQNFHYAVFVHVSVLSARVKEKVAPRFGAASA
jgi:hypothetical protein